MTGAAAAAAPRVLIVARNYPNNVFPGVGMWAQRQTRALAQLCPVTVVAPSPYYPPLPGPERLRRFTRVESSCSDGKIAVYHPQFLTGPGHTTYALEGLTQYFAIKRLIDRHGLSHSFDLIHAHFSYADGVTAALLARRYRVPFIVTEHTLLRPWISQYPVVERQTRLALLRAAAVVGVSRAVGATIQSVTRGGVRPLTIPIGVDGDLFPLRGPRTWGDEERVLFVGWLRRLKGVDVLLRSMAILRDRRPQLRLLIAGGAPFEEGEREQQTLQRLAAELGLQACVTFLGYQPPGQVARLMREVDLLVLPSHRESCGSVLIEALASGIPVVATRCGGPEDIVNPAVGALVPVDDPPPLAEAIERILQRRDQYDPARLRDYALSNYSWARLSQRYVELYRTVLEQVTVN